MKKYVKKYVVSLEKDHQRRELFFSQPDTADFEVFNAINTMVLEDEILQHRFDFSQFKQRYQRNVTKGEIGCTMSHLAIYQQIAEDPTIHQNDYVLICEDDALFAANFQQNLTALCQEITAKHVNADMILVGQSKIPHFNDRELQINYPTTFKRWQKPIGNTGYCYAYPYKNYFAGTVAYLIKKSAVTPILNALNQGKPFWLADDFILYEQQFKLDILVVRPLMVIENPTLTSNLENLRGSLDHRLWQKLLKFPFKKLLAIKRNREK